MAYNAFRRVPAQRFKPPVMKHKPFPSPTRGWVSAVNLSMAPEGSAQVLENWYPTSTGIQMRSGSLQHGTVDAPVESLMTYIGGSTRKMFAAADGNIYDVTSPADPDVAPTPDVTGQTSNYYSFANMATVGGNFMLAANGTDEIQKYDGSAWSPIVSGVSAGEIDGVASDAISHLNTYRNRIWMVEGGTMKAWYLPTDSIAGVAEAVSLAGVFRKGGALLFTATWSMDAGDGLDDKIVFVSTEGEVAVYQGDPSGPDWGSVGLYDSSPPLGKNAHLRVGGDLLLLTELGVIPLSAIISKDPAALALAAVSRNIQPDWTAEMRNRRGLPWEVVKWTSRNLAYVSCPVTSTYAVTPPVCFAVNLETGAWSKVTGWNTRCMALHNDQVYFGTNDGEIMQADVGGSDNGNLIYYTYVGHNDHLGYPGQTKTVRQARAVFRTGSEIIPQLSVSTDYVVSLPTFPNAPAGAESPGVWDVGLWDVAQWDAGQQLFTAQTRWVSIGQTGFSHAPQLQLVSGADVAPSAELIMFEMTYEPGGLVV